MLDLGDGWVWTGSHEKFVEMAKKIRETSPGTLLGLPLVTVPEKPKKKYRMVNGRVKEVK